jgi:hypothetical protein
MTVQELIDKLKQFDPAIEVVASVAESAGTNIHTVRKPTDPSSKRKAVIVIGN